MKHHMAFLLDAPCSLGVIMPRIKVFCGMVDRKNVSAVTALRGEAVAWEFKKFLNNKQFGVYAWCNNAVVGYAWAGVCKNSHWRVNGYLKISKGQAFIHSCYVDKDYRKNNIYSAMLTALCERLFTKANVTGVFIESDEKNFPSIKAVEKVGFKPFGVRHYAVFSNRIIIDCHTVKEYLSIRYFPGKGKFKKLKNF